MITKVKCLLLLSNFNHAMHVTNYRKTPNIKWDENTFSSFQVVTRGQVERQTAKPLGTLLQLLIVKAHKSAKANVQPTKFPSHCFWYNGKYLQNTILF
jgi:hypothetical protein